MINRVLIINAHPEFNNKNAVSLKVLDHFREKLKEMDSSC